MSCRERALAENDSNKLRRGICGNKAGKIYRKQRNAPFFIDSLHLTVPFGYCAPETRAGGNYSVILYHFSSYKSIVKMTIGQKQGLSGRKLAANVPPEAKNFDFAVPKTRRVWYNRCNDITVSPERIFFDSEGDNRNGKDIAAA